MLPVVVMMPVPVFNVPATLTPVPVIVNVVLPTAATVTLPLAVAILTLLLPFAHVPMILPPKKLLPAPTNIAYELVTVALVLAVGFAWI